MADCVTTPVGKHLCAQPYHGNIFQGLLAVSQSLTSGVAIQTFAPKSKSLDAKTRTQEGVRFHACHACHVSLCFYRTEKKSEQACSILEVPRPCSPKSKILEWPKINEVYEDALSSKRV